MSFITRAVSGWTELNEALRNAPPATVVVINPYADDETAPAREMFTLMEAFPSVAVVGAFVVTPARVGDVRQMLQAGISGVVNLRVDTTPEVAARHIREAVGRPVKRQVEAALPQHLSADARHIIRAACDVALVGGGVDDVAAVFEVNAKTLSLWCNKFKLGPTRSLLVWIRLLLAASLLEDRGRTVDSAARAAGYSSDRGLRRAFEQTLGTAPSTVRKGGALALVSRAFREHLVAVAAIGRG
ncbi:MAG TPA: helix-turn-helix domain-containing protein [Longimicrobium sp.]|nr:helix-turn-helix domain-containing protein [Longimicrobium sp.]